MPQPFTPEEAQLSHRNNLLQKWRLTDDAEHQALCRQIDEKYNEYLASLSPDNIAAGDLEDAVGAVGSYLDFAKEVESERPAVPSCVVPVVR